MFRSSATHSRFFPAGLLVTLLMALAGCGSQGGPSQRPPLEETNVLLLVIDTLGAEFVGACGSEAGVTPRLDELAARGRVFRRAYATAPWTQPSVASLLTSRMPHEHGVVRLKDTLGPEARTLAEALRERGFATGAVISHFLLEARFGFDQGFDHFDESPIAGHEGITSPAVTDRALAWLEQVRQKPQPFFLMAHYFDPHFLYQHHPEFDRTTGYQGELRPGMDIWSLRDARESLAPDDVAYLRGLYEEEVAFTDHHIGRLLDGLAALGLAEDTLVVVVADHGEEFMRHGWIGHTRTLYDELLRVPLIIAWPGVVEPGRIDTPVSLLDVVPTLLGLSAQPPLPEGSAPESFAGISLLPFLLEGLPVEERDLFAEVSFPARSRFAHRAEEKTAFKTALIAGDAKLIHDLSLEGREHAWEFYDLAKDPHELTDLFGEDPQRHERDLLSRLRRWEAIRENPRVRWPPLPEGTEQESPADEEDRQRLRSLGYLP